MSERVALSMLAYLAASVLFIFGLKGLTHPRTAVRGNLLGALGMLVAVITVLVTQQIIDWWIVAAALAIGGLAGVILAVRIPMTAMPQMVALLNGFGGIASALVAGAALVQELAHPDGLLSAYLAGQADHNQLVLALQLAVATAASGLIGSVTFTGSLVAFGKLQGLINEQPVLLPARHVLNVLLLVACLGLAAYLVHAPDAVWSYYLLAGLALVLGVMLVMPIGGADMPVVIALLNSYSGLAASATGFVINNSVLIIAGALVGASGLILTQIMCKAMNRSLANVLFGGVGAISAKGGGDAGIYEGKIKATSAEEIAMLLDGARRVVFVPGYGMAVAQAQHAVRDLGNLLEQRGAEVEYAIHPVAGRMPGHMNVLLAEANVPYDKLKEMDEINPTFAQTDVAIVIGANDTVNPSARTDPDSPIAGMPILNVDQARTVVVIKRSLSPGFAGVPNPLFAADNTLMFFADAKRAVLDITSAVKET